MPKVAERAGLAAMRGGVERAEEYKLPAIHVQAVRCEMPISHERAVVSEMPNGKERTGTLKMPATAEWGTCAN